MVEERLNLSYKVKATGDSMVNIPPANAGNAGLIPGSGRPDGEGNGNPLQYSFLENSMHRGACVFVIDKSRT